MGKKGKRKQRTVGGAGSSGGAASTKFTAPTSGLEDVYFTWGTTKDAAKFEDTVSNLATSARVRGRNPRSHQRGCLH